MSKIKVVHYINQFFAQIGGEEKADYPAEIRVGEVVGPGLALTQNFKDEAEIIATVICGDSYFNENLEKAKADILAMVKEQAPDVFIAGPAFNAGRYGVACGTIAAAVLKMHEEWHGKIETCAKSHVNSREDLAIAYTPGVAEPCKVIARDPEAAYTYTMKSNTVAVVSDGSAVLGLGNIGALAAMPVMEGKAVLFKEFGGVNAVPICLDTQNTEEIIKSVVNIAPAFGGINLEDISAPRCFEIEERLKELLDIPVFHDDQHGTAIVVLAGIINAMKVTGKDKESAKVVVNGAGSAGVAITKLLLTYGFKNVTMCDISGILGKGSQNLNWMQQKMVEVTNPEQKTGTLADALKGADIFVGVSAPNIVTQDMVASMNKDAILFAMANPVPEIMPDIAKAAGAKVVGTGRSDFPNQVNNVVAFPGIFKGALEGRATAITEEMKLATAKAIAGLVPDEELNENNILPEAFDPRVADVVSRAVKELI